MSVSDSPFCQFDHLVVCASDLKQGVSWFERQSDVTLPFGGSHPLMATHNHLSALSSNSFLEIIAVDPQAPQPSRKRWFALDNPATQESLRITPALTTWVVSTRNLKSALHAVSEAGIDAGKPVTQTRGDLQWQIALLDDGSLAYDGAFPILIQWPEGVNPVSRMENHGIRLNSLQLHHPEAETIRRGLRALGMADFAEVKSGTRGITAQLSTASLHFTLSSCHCPHPLTS